jgi:8-oxo-dGTP pyrophosphatase MutT (NUDIX family)
MSMKTLIKKLLRESIDKTIKCGNCGWAWKKSEGGPDMYFCHKCGYDNTPDNITEEEKEREAAGVLIKCEKTGRILLLLRNDKIPSWSLVAGGIEYGETPIECLKREIQEEMSINPNIVDIKKVRLENIKDKNLKFYYHQGFTKEEFTPKLNDEHIDWGWFSKDDLPTPLYRGTYEKIKNI